MSTYDHSYSGWTSIESATIRSDNSVFAQLTVDVGPENVAATARRMGVRTPLLAVPSLGLGAIAISPLDLASGYATIAGRGMYSRPMAIRKVILRDGRVDTEAGWGKPQRRRVMTDGEAYVITKILEDNMRYGTGTGAALVRPAAGKTGTTDDHADAWFAGFTPDLTTVVWVGYPQGEIPMESVHGISVSGGSFPADIWRRYMQRALWSSPPLEWEEPSELPDWEPWERGDDVLSYDPYAVPEPPAPPTRRTSRHLLRHLNPRRPRHRLHPRSRTRCVSAAPRCARGCWPHRSFSPARPCPRVGSAASGDTWTSISTAPTRRDWSTGAFPIATCSSSTRRARSSCSCRRRSSPTTTTGRSSRS